MPQVGGLPDGFPAQGLSLSLSPDVQDAAPATDSGLEREVLFTKSTHEQGSDRPCTECKSLRMNIYSTTNAFLSASISIPPYPNQSIPPYLLNTTSLSVMQGMYDLFHMNESKLTYECNQKMGTWHCKRLG